MKKTNIIIGVVVLVVLVLVIYFVSQTPQQSSEKEETKSISNVEKLSGECVELGGAWIFEYNECEYAGEDWCKQNKGKFLECESACRNDPEAEICTLQCVSVCEF